MRRRERNEQRAVEKGDRQALLALAPAASLFDEANEALYFELKAPELDVVFRLQLALVVIERRIERRDQIVDHVLAVVASFAVWVFERRDLHESNARPKIFDHGLAAVGGESHAFVQDVFAPLTRFFLRPPTAPEAMHDRPVLVQFRGRQSARSAPRTHALLNRGFYFFGVAFIDERAQELDAEAQFLPPFSGKTLQIFELALDRRINFAC